MNTKYSFRFESRENRRQLPSKLIIARNEPETAAHVVLKVLAFLLFHRDRLQMETNLHIEHISFVPDLIQLDYTLRPALWVECGDCSVTKLDKLAVKVPEAEIWIVKKSLVEAQQLLKAMERGGLRKNRYGLIAFDSDLFNEITGLLENRNEILWYVGSFEPGLMQFDFNSLWFELTFETLRF